MNILVIAPTPFFADRGTHIRILEEALALEKPGHRITIATYHIGAPLPEYLHTKIDVRRIRRLLFWRKMKLVADFHGSLTKEMVSHQYLRTMGLHKIFLLIERFINNLGDVAVASSWDNASDINAVRTKNVAQILLDGTRLSMFEALPPSVDIRATYHIPENKVLVTYTGALIPNKGIKVLLDAIPLV